MSISTRRSAGGSGQREARHSARHGGHEPPPTVEPLCDHVARGKCQQALPAESETAKSDGHDDETDRGAHGPDHAQAEEGRREANRCGERNHPRSVPVDRATAGSEEEAARAGADEVGDRQLQAGQSGRRDEVVGEDADSGGLAGDRGDRSDRARDHHNPPVVERHPPRVERTVAGQSPRPRCLNIWGCRHGFIDPLTTPWHWRLRTRSSVGGGGRGEVARPRQRAWAAGDQSAMPESKSVAVKYAASQQPTRDRHETGTGVLWKERE